MVFKTNGKIEYYEYKDILVIPITPSHRNACKLLEQQGQGDKPFSVEIKPHREKKTQSQNGYAWQLITKMAGALETSADEVYIDLLKKYGQRGEKLFSVVTDGVDMMFKAMDNHCVVVGKSEVDGKEFSHLAILIGSSKYDTKQMYDLLKGIVGEADDLGIETMTPRELAQLREQEEKSILKKA